MATIVKTKDLMIEVARQLFARVGFTNTTMNDIADASNKGRRTLYTYFRNKDEIFHAVIERDSSDYGTTSSSSVASPPHPRKRYSPCS